MSDRMLAELRWLHAPQSLAPVQGVPLRCAHCKDPYPCTTRRILDRPDAPAGATVEIGGEVMSQSQFDAARFPLLHPNQGTVVHGDEHVMTFDAPVPAGATVTREAVRQAVYDTLWRLHGPDSTDEESCAMDAEDVTSAVLALGITVTDSAEPSVAELQAQRLCDADHQYEDGAR